jgi:hypothetical protein
MSNDLRTGDQIVLFEVLTSVNNVLYDLKFASIDDDDEKDR